MGDPAELDLLRLLDLAEHGADHFSTDLRVPGRFGLYGGQVAAQALVAAGRTVAADRPPHSLHAYFLRRGLADRPTHFTVDRDRDGGSFSARRVVARQGDEAILTMSCSFHVRQDEPDAQDVHPEPGPPPGDLPVLATGLLDLEVQVPPQPRTASAWPQHLWVRTTVALPDDLLVQAAALTYVSDLSTGLVSHIDETSAPGPSLDHAVWFHRPLDLTRWTQLDVAPRTVGRGRGVYSGAMFDEQGRLGASIAQESLFGRRAEGRHSVG